MPSDLIATLDCTSECARPEEAAIEQIETCAFCGEQDNASAMGLWLISRETRPVHLKCWLIAYDARRIIDAHRHME